MSPILESPPGEKTEVAARAVADVAEREHRFEVGKAQEELPAPGEVGEARRSVLPSALHHGSDVGGADGIPRPDHEIPGGPHRDPYSLESALARVRNALASSADKLTRGDSGDAFERGQVSGLLIAADAIGALLRGVR